MATKKSGGSRKNTPRGSNTARKTSGNGSYTTSRQRQEALAKEARQDRAKRTWKTIGIAFLVLILLAVLGFAGFGIAYVVTDGFGGKVPTAVIMIEDDMYTASADGIAIYPGDEIRVQSLTGATEYDVRIEANAESGDFSFTVGAEPYTWHDLAGQDVTKGFTLTQTDLGFTVDYESFETIIAEVMGADVVIAEDADLSGDMFDLVITMGETEYRFGFGIGLPVSGIELDPDHIVINADKQPVEEPEEPSVGEKYSIGYDLLGGGSATINFKNGTEQFVNSGFAQSGDTVEFTFSDVTENYRVSRVTLQDYNTGSDIHDIVDENDDGTYTFVMPSQDVIVMVYVIPADSYKIVYDTLGSGSVDSVELDCPVSAKEGETVNFTISLPDLSDIYDDYVPLKVVNVILQNANTGDDLETLTPDGNAYSFEMPNFDVQLMIYLMPED